MKKLLSLLLALAVLTGCVTVFASASEKIIPAVIVTGYASCSLYLDYGEETQETVWPFAVTDAFAQIISDKENLVYSLNKLMEGDIDTFARTVGEGGEIMLELMYCNEDSSSRYNVTHYPNDPAITNHEYLITENDGENIYETQLAEALSEKIGGENVFSFQYDFRMGVTDCAAELEKYVKDVMEYTSSSQINLFGMSYGGYIVGSYLSLYGDEGFVNNAVLDVPALGGTTFARDFLLGEVDLPIKTLVTFGETALGLFGLETDLARLFKNYTADKIDAFASGFLQAIIDLPMWWGSMWDLLTVEDYNELKPMLLDSTKNAELIRKCDISHYEIMPNYVSKFNALREDGMKISIICSTGSDTAFGDEVNADVLLNAGKTSGAACAPLGMRFADGYKACGTNCADPNHYHISPSMEIDASSAYLPENTWFIDGQYHGLYAFEEYSLSLVMELMLADEEIDIYSLPEYPQFEVSSNSHLGLHAKMNVSGTGYVSSEDTALVLKNVSGKYPIKLLSIVSNGVELDFDLSAIGTIASGETVEIPFTGEIPAVSATRAAVTVNFVKLGCINPLNSITFDLTIRNGASPEYAGGFVNTDFPEKLSTVVSQTIFNTFFDLPIYTAIKVLAESYFI